MSKLEHVSYSQLGLWAECPKKYEHQYILKTEAPDYIKPYFIKGDLSHKLLECKANLELGGIPRRECDIDTYFSEIVGLWLVNECKLGKDISHNLKIGSLFYYCKKYSNLLERATCDYKGNDAIRTTEGGMPKVPERTKSFRKSLEEIKPRLWKISVLYIPLYYNRVFS
ncbi:MAG: PD-(D/E)XK nuclease family protein [Hormoscilla sp. GM102CHS1]|nr:PD-(D/E)XK nuclease family protein [Hormoscilla sp. GM102CHS1]